MSLLLSPMMSPAGVGGVLDSSTRTRASPRPSPSPSQSVRGATPRKRALQTSGGVVTPSGRFVAPVQASSRRTSDRFVPARGGECNPALRAQVASLAAGANKRTLDGQDLLLDDDIADRENIEPMQMPGGGGSGGTGTAAAAAAAHAAALERAAHFQLLGNTLMDLQRAGRTASTYTASAATVPPFNPMLVVHAPAPSAGSSSASPSAPLTRQAHERLLAPSTGRSGSSRSSGGFQAGAHPMSALNFSSSPLTSPGSRQQQQQGQPRRRASEGIPSSSMSHVPRSITDQILSTPHASSAPMSSVTSPAAHAAIASRTRSSFGASSSRPIPPPPPSLLFFGRSAAEEVAEHIAAVADAARRDSLAFDRTAAAAHAEEEAQAASLWNAQVELQQRLQEDDASTMPPSAMQSPAASAPSASAGSVDVASGVSAPAFEPASFHTPQPAASVSSAVASTAAAITRSANKRSALRSAALSASMAAATPTRVSAAAAGGHAFAAPTSSSVSFSALHYPPHLAHSVSRATRQLQMQGSLSARHMR